MDFGSVSGSEIVSNTTFWCYLFADDWVYAKKENDELAVINLKKFWFLDNSAEFYSHDFLYYFSKEVLDNYEMFKLVNGEKCRTDSDNTDVECNLVYWK